MLWLVAANAAATQVCTTQEFNKEFRGISGSSDNNVIAVGKKGTIYRYDGTSWSLMASGTDEDLNDVEALGPTAFAVGKKGEVLQLVGGSWISHTGFTDEELFGVWAASPTEVYVAGKKGELYFYDGTSWTDVSDDADTDKDDLTDIWGYAYGVYVIDEEGVLYIYDRTSGTWLPPNSSCTIGDKFEDLWGDSSGNVYLAAKKDVYRYDGASCSVVATADQDLRGIYGWTQEGTAIAVGKKGTVFEFDGSSWTESQTIEEDELLDDWVSRAGNAYYAGKKKELTVCDCVDCPPPSGPLFVITHDSYGIHCQDEVIQVQVFENVSGTPRIDYYAEVTADTQSGFGSWSRVAGSGAFNDATLNDGIATYDWPLGEYSATFALSYREGPASIDVDIYQTSVPGYRDDNSEGTLLFGPNGFTLTAAPLSNPPPLLIVPFMASQSAGTDFPIHIAAYGETPNDPVCGIIESYTGSKNLKLWSGHIDPVSGTRTPTIDGVLVAAAKRRRQTQPSRSPTARLPSPASTRMSAESRSTSKTTAWRTRICRTASVARRRALSSNPHHFELTDIETGAGSPNPAAADSSRRRIRCSGRTIRSDRNRLRCRR